MLSEDEAAADGTPKGSLGTCSHSHRNPCFHGDPPTTPSWPVRRARGYTRRCRNHPTPAPGWRLTLPRGNVQPPPQICPRRSCTRGHSSPGQLHLVESATKPRVLETHLQLLYTNSGKQFPEEARRRRKLQERCTHSP